MEATQRSQMGAQPLGREFLAREPRGGAGGCQLGKHAENCGEENVNKISGETRVISGFCWVVQDPYCF